MARSTVEQWRMFKAVADHGGFHQASEMIYKSQSSIHHAVHKLEEMLGVSLLRIDGRRTHLTPAGDQLLRRINYLLAETERMENVALNLKSGVESRLNIAVDEAFPKDILYRALAAVSAEYPLIRIELMETILTGANELLSQGKAEIAISPYTIPNNLSEDICQVEFLAVAGKDHPLNRPSRDLELEELKNCRQIVLRDSGQHEKKDVGWLGSEQRWTVSHVATSIELLRKNLGFAWLPLHAVKPYLEDGSIVPLRLPRGATRSNSIYLNFNDTDTLGPVAHAFIEYVRHLSVEARSS